MGGIFWREAYSLFFSFRHRCLSRARWWVDCNLFPDPGAPEGWGLE